MRRILLALAVALAGLATTSLLASSASASKTDRANGSLTASGCALTDAVSWEHLPRIYEIDTTLNQDGLPYIVGASIISYPQLGESALTSPQLIETFAMGSEIFTHSYTVTFVLKDRHGRVVASTTSPAVAVACDFV